MKCENYCPVTFSTAATCYVCSHHRRCNKEAAVSATNTNNGKTGYGMLYQIPASKDSRNPKINQV